MKAAIISIGDELLIGQVVNTNAAFISQKLISVGILVHEVRTIGDDEQQILDALEECFRKFDVIVATGGLGPTHDDVTRSAVCRFFSTDLVLDDSVLANIRALMQRRNLPWTKAAEDQAMLPRGTRVIPNKHGTAPGMLFERDNRYLIVMPGVPYEMEAMVNDFVAPLFQSKKGGQVVRHRTLKTTGIPESFLAARLGNVDELLDGAKLAFLPTPLGVRMRITVIDNDTPRAERRLGEVENRIRAKAEKFIYGTDDEELEHVVGRILSERELTIAVAESCTGGMIAHKITNVPGSSNYLERAVVTYSDKSKTELLGVPADPLERFGAVSQQVAEAMASGVRARSATDIGISTTGIAGPTGGTPEKPVGLVWIGYSDSKETFALKFNFGDERVRFKERASQAALELLRRKLLRIEPQVQGNV